MELVLASSAMAGEDEFLHGGRSDLEDALELVLASVADLSGFWSPSSGCAAPLRD
jgi:hypothetical protein